MAGLRGDQWAVVQHSGYVITREPAFEKGLETRRATPAQARQVLAAGGILFDDYGLAEMFAENAMYPLGVEGLVPQARGTFGTLTIDGLPVYLPVRQVIG